MPSNKGMVGMNDHEISDILRKYMHETVEVTDIRIGLRCSVCGHTWGVRVEDTQELIKQIQKLVCLPCYQKAIENRNVRNVHYEQNTKTFHKTG